MYNIIVKRPLNTEIKELNNFFELVIRDTFAKNNISDLIASLEEEIIDKKRCLTEDIESGGKLRYFLVATLDNKIVGTIEHGPANDLIKTCTQGELAELQEIGTVYVDPKHQNQGIGSLLLTKMFEVLYDKKIEEFCFDSGYKSAQKIWRKKFGEPEYHLKNYWGDGADHMVWRLNTIDVLQILNLL